MKLKGKALIAQGGGPTAVINQSLTGIVLEARKHKNITKIYGALNGVSGIVNEDFLDLTKETTKHLEEIANTPSSALYTTRVKPDENYCKEIFKVFMAHDIRYFFYIGGNDSSETVRIINQEANEANYELRAIHVPKTIDNDLVINDHTPGYASAAKFVAQSFIGLNLDNRALPGIHIGIVMGRHAGFLTAAASIASKELSEGPHLVYLPERNFIIDNFIKNVKETYEKYGRCVIAVSEGIVDENGVAIATKLGNEETDAHGNCQLSGTGALGDLLAEYIREHTEIKKVRSDTFGYLQRSFVGCVSNIDQMEAREAGKMAVKFAIKDNVDGSVVIKRTGHYKVDYDLVPLEDIAAKTKLMPDEFINEAGNGVTQAFKDYLTPLLGDMPEYSFLNSPKVEKLILK